MSFDYSLRMTPRLIMNPNEPCEADEVFLTWRGKPLDQLSQDELIAAVKDCYNEILTWRVTSRALFVTKCGVRVEVKC